MDEIGRLVETIDRFLADTYRLATACAALPVENPDASSLQLQSGLLAG